MTASRICSNRPPPLLGLNIDRCVTKRAQRGRKRKGIGRGETGKIVGKGLQEVGEEKAGSEIFKVAKPRKPRNFEMLHIFSYRNGTKRQEPLWKVVSLAAVFRVIA